MGESQKLLQVHLPGSRTQKIHASNHFCDTGFAVIHRNSQLIDIYAVSPANHHIAAIGGKIQGIVTLNMVGNAPDPVRNFHTPGRLPVKSGPLFRRQVPAGAGIDISAVGQMGGIDRVELASGAVTGVQQAQVCHFFKIAVVNPAPLALGRCFHIPVKAQPPEIVPQNGSEIRTGPLGVQIFHSENQFTILAADGEPCDQSCKNVTQVHPAGRGGRKTAHYFFLFHYRMYSSQ